MKTQFAELTSVRFRDAEPSLRESVLRYVEQLTMEADNEPGGTGSGSVHEWVLMHPHNQPGGDDERGLFATFLFLDAGGGFVATVTVSENDRDARQRHSLKGKGFIGFYHVARPFRGNAGLAAALFDFACDHIARWVRTTSESVEFYLFTDAKHEVALRRKGFVIVGDKAVGAAGFDEEPLFVREFKPGP